MFVEKPIKNARIEIYSFEARTIEEVQRSLQRYEEKQRKFGFRVKNIEEKNSKVIIKMEGVFPNNLRHLKRIFFEMPAVEVLPFPDGLSH